MSIHVFDANILIDADKLGAARTFIGLAGRSLITDWCWRESWTVKDVPIGKGPGKLEIVEVGDHVSDLFHLPMPAGCSTEDRSALWLAERERGMLLTSDKLLRRTAEARGCEVHGLLWLIKQHWQEESITAKDALKFLDRLEYDGPQFRLPKEEIQKLRRVIGK